MRSTHATSCSVHGISNQHDRADDEHGLEALCEILIVSRNMRRHCRAAAAAGLSSYSGEILCDIHKMPNMQKISGKGQRSTWLLRELRTCAAGTEKVADSRRPKCLCRSTYYSCFPVSSQTIPDSFWPDCRDHQAVTPNFGKP